MKALFIAFLLGCALLWSSYAHAQTLRGTVTDSLGKPVSYATINLKGSGNLVLGYTNTDNKGIYQLPVPPDADQKNLYLEASYLGYKKQSKQVNNVSALYNFRLSPASRELNTVIVKDNRPRLRVNGDTLSYKVSEFSTPQDRVIGDVIKKLPGIEMDANGKIKYNGKAISNLYIGGDNLLDDKYNIATSTIPSDAVDKVQVMENHQPIKMLKDKVVSDDVALNIKLKDEAKIQLVGQATLGAGLPKKYDENINAMMFKDKYKAINYFKGNNTGFDVANDLISHNINDYLNRLDNNKPSTLLSLGAAGNPDLPVNRYLFNQSALFNFNNLFNVKKDVQLRANISYLHDVQRQQYSKFTQTYLPDDTITYTETQRNKRRPDLIHAQLNVNINKEKYYLNNAFIGDINYNTAYSALNTNGNQVNQKLIQNSFDFSNEFNYLNTFKSGKIINYYSYINHVSQPENRIIEPGLNANIFNGGVPYNELLQRANVPTWFTNNYVGLKLPGNKLTQQYKLGFNMQSQQLTSSLYTIQTNGNTKPALDSAMNDLNWQRRKFYAEAGFDIPGNKLKMSFNVPVTLQQIAYDEELYQLHESLTRLYVNPQLSLKYQTSAENYLSFSYAYRNNIGDISNVYRGYILTNYRTLYANNAGITERKSQSANLGFNYRKAIQMFFFGVNVGYTHSEANNITYSNITPNFQQRIVLPYQNATDSWTAMGSVSKYAFDLRSTFSAGALWQANRSNQIVNRILLPYQTYITSINAGVESKISNRINFSYKAYLTRTGSRSSVATSTAFYQLQHQASINYNPTDNLLFKLSGDNYFTHQPQMNNLNYAFADFSARYKFNTSKIDVELNALNILNTKTYSNAYLTANTFTSSVYQLPGRMLVAKISFNY
ncbi:TonB-dependent receptor [Mucilaginibacter koreensis]